MITVVRGQKGVIAIYLGNDLTCTHDKFSRPEDIELAIEQRGGGKVVEKTGKFSSVSEIPVFLKEPKQTVPDAPAGNA